MLPVNDTYPRLIRDEWVREKFSCSPFEVVDGDLSSFQGTKVSTDGEGTKVAEVGIRDGK